MIRNQRPGHWMRLLVLLLAIVTVSACAGGYAFTERKKETLPDGTAREYDEPLPLWMQIASFAKVALVGEGKTDPRFENDNASRQMLPPPPKSSPTDLASSR